MALLNYDSHVHLFDEYHFIVHPQNTTAISKVS